MLGSTPPSQWYKVLLPEIFIHEIIVLNGVLAIPELDGWFIHDEDSDSGSVCRGMLGSTPGTQRDKVHLCRIETQEFAVFCGKDLYSCPSNSLIDSGLLHNWLIDLHSICGRLLALTPGTQRYKVYPCRIRTQEFTVFRGGCLRY